jgi:predicted permease
VAPLLYASRLSVEQALRTGGRGGASTSGARLRSALVVTEIALSTALAIGAFLMVKSFYVQQRVDHGFRTEGVVTMELSLRGGGLETAAQRLSFTERLREDLRPVSTAAGLASHLPVADGYLASLEAEGQPVERGQGRRAAEVSVTEGYLEALEVPVVGGRLFTATEHRHGSEVVLVSARLARELWGTTDVVGRRLRNGLGGEEPWLRVVGVVGDVDAGRDMVQPDSANWLQLYRPYASSPVRQLTLVAQSDRPTEELAIALRQAVRRAGAAVPTAEVLSMRQAIHRQRWVTRFFSEELALYAGIALVIATLGLYGLVAESVARRQHEMAIRLAVGADRAGVLGLVVGHGARLAAIGVALGLLLGLPAARAAASMLGGVSPADPFILGGVVLVLASASLLASYLPARRAAAVDPAQSLRAE